MKKSLREIERSLIKTYRKTIWTNFIKAVKEFELVERGDKIAIAISGGKDSLLLAKLFQELKRHKLFDFSLEFIAMDPGYRTENRDRLEENCRALGIDVKVHDSNIFEVADDLAKNGSPCYMCARMRRGNLYNRAQELGCNKLALGHHMDDVIETVLLNLVFAGEFKTMMPKLHSQNFKGLELIRPMYYIREEYVKRWINSTGLYPLDCACTVTEKKSGNKRYYIKELISELKHESKNVEINLLRATENVNMGAILGYRDEFGKHSFMEDYR